jgi:hypothetical protein
MGLFTNSKSRGSQGSKGWQTSKQAKAKADKLNNPSTFKQRKAAAVKGKGKK